MAFIILLSSKQRAYTHISLERVYLNIARGLYGNACVYTQHMFHQHNSSLHLPEL